METGERFKFLRTAIESVRDHATHDGAFRRPASGNMKTSPFECRGKAGPHERVRKFLAFQVLRIAFHDFPALFANQIHGCFDQLCTDASISVRLGDEYT